ncbi:MAG: HPr family phosphocarrier protein [Spirochaetales bacterium]|nr:HPr family phosphocarrier protein [Spirochaetales bacterium]
MKRARATVQHAVGLHARPAARFVKRAKEYESAITVRNITRDGETVDAKSLVKVIKIAAAQRQEVEIVADGPDEEEALAALLIFLDDVSEEER